jgi:hypothetical protein
MSMRVVWAVLDYQAGLVAEGQLTCVRGVLKVEFKIGLDLYHHAYGTCRLWDREAWQKQLHYTLVR